MYNPQTAFIPPDSQMKTGWQDECRKRKESMKNCPVCNAQLEDSVRFCSRCGTAQPTAADRNGNAGGGLLASEYRKKKKRRKILCISLACVLLAAALGVGGTIAWGKVQQQHYAEDISTAERYLLDQEYDRAEEKYLSAQKIDPRKTEPYVGLYEVYTATEQETRKTEITEQAKENLSEEDLASFEKEAKEIDQKYLPVDGYAILQELGALDRTPISVNGEMWIIQKDGEFSFLSPSGEILSEYSTESLQLVPQESLKACLPDADGQAAVHNQWPTGREGAVSQCTGFGGTGPWMEIVLGEDGRPVISDESAQSFADWKERQKTARGPGTIPEPEDQIPEVPVFLKAENGSADEYHIWNPVNDTVYGPYTQNSHASVAAQLVRDAAVEYTAAWSFRISEPGDWYQTGVNGPYWTRQPDGQYSLWSGDGRSRLENANNVLLVDLDSVAFRPDWRLFVLDENLNLQFVGDFEQAGRAIENIAPVCTEGTWKLVQFTDHKGQSREKKKLNGQIQTLEPQSDNLYVVENNVKEASNPEISAMMIGEMKGQSRSYAMETFFVLQTDGSFTGHWQEAGQGEVLSAEYHGNLHLKEIRDGATVLQVDQVVADTDTGRKWTMDDGTAASYKEPEQNGLKEGDELIWYPPGYAKADLPQAMQEKLLLQQYSNGDTVSLGLYWNPRTSQFFQPNAS